MVTDHKPLLGLFSENSGLPDRSAARILCWALLLSEYDYTLEYRPGIACSCVEQTTIRVADRGCVSVKYLSADDGVGSFSSD